jgi:hypothetical protein
MRKISQAPRPTGSLPTGHAAPEPAPKTAAKSEPKQSTQSYYRFLEAIHRRDRPAAEFYAQKCRHKDLPETLLKELSLLDICQTRGTRGPQAIKEQAVEKAMWDYIWKKGRENFLDIKKVGLPKIFKAGETTCWKVRNVIKSRLNENSDKTPTKLRQLRPTPTDIK